MQTAWLKAHYPNEFMAAVLTSYMGKTDKIVHYVNACRHEGIKIMQPDINESGRDFTATKEGIRFGFAGIRGVGESAAETIMAERRRGGDFTSLHDFVDRVDSSAANRRVTEALIKAGAFDSTGYTRRQCMNLVDKNNPENIIDAAAKRQKDKAQGQVSFFDMFDGDDDSGFSDMVPDPDGIEWDRHMKLALEKEVLGIYVSDHPLRPYEYALKRARDYTIADLESSQEAATPAGTNMVKYKVEEDKPIWIAGMVSKVDKKTTKKGDFMAIVTLEDIEAETSVVVFPQTFKKCESILRGEVDEQTGESLGDVFVRIQGKLERSDRGNQIIASQVEPIDLNDKANKPKTLCLYVEAKDFTRSYMERLKSILVRYEGLDTCSLEVEAADGTLVHMDLGLPVDAANMVLKAELRDALAGSGALVVV